MLAGGTLLGGFIIPRDVLRPPGSECCFSSYTQPVPFCTGELFLPLLPIPKRDLISNQMALVVKCMFNILYLDILWI